MDIEKYISSGVLELYVSGALSEAQNQEVAEYAAQYPEIKTEIEAIEASILALSGAAYAAKAPKFGTLKSRLSPSTVVKPLHPKTSNSWINYMGWAASVVLAAGLFWVFTQNNRLKSDVDRINQENLFLEQQISNAQDSKEETESLLQLLREKEIEVVLLGGQEIAPTAFAKVYWNAKTEKVFIDAQGLPEPPDGMVYQVWSLKLSPTLTPTSLGLLEDFASDTNKVFPLVNPNASEGFGITLEPAGGSESPTLEKLYTLGVINS